MALFVVAGLFLSPARTHAATGINKQINFQGKVTNPNGTNVTNGTYTFVFKFYTVSTAGAAAWTETDSLLVTDGIFQVNLGAVTPLPGSLDFNTDNLFLGITFNSDPAGEMLPRIQLTASPYAFNSDMLDGLDSTAFAQLGASAQTFTGTNTFQPTTNVSSVLVKQTSFATPTADIFNVQTANNTNVLQVTGPTANEAAVTLQSVGATRALTLTSQAAATWSTVAGTLTIQGGGGTTLASAAQTAVASGTVALQSGATSAGSSINSGDITLTTGNATGATSNSGSISLNIGSATGTRGSITIGTGANVPNSITIGQATVPSTSIVGSVLNLGSVSSSTASSTIHIADTSSATGTQAVTIGSSAANAANTVTLNSGAIVQTNTDSGVTIKTNTDSATAFQVQSSNTESVIAISTANNNANNLVTNSNFDVNTLGWANKNGSGTSALTRVTSNYYFDGASMQVQTSGTATNAGASYNIALSNTTRYTFTLYVQASGTNFSTFDMGYGSGAADTSCLTAQTVVQSGWTRLTCSFTTGTLGATPYIYVKQTDAVGKIFFIDGVLLETDANASSNYRDGNITLQGTITSPVVIQNTANSTNALAVQNSAGTSVFGVDTTDTNLVSNPGLETNTVSWAGKSTGTLPVILRDSSNPYLGNAGLKIVTGTTAQDGVKYTFPNNTSLLASTQYSLSFYAKISTGSLATFAFGRSDTGVAAGETSCVTTGTLTTNWARFSCSFTTGGTMGASGNPYIYISQGAGTASITFFIDAVSVEPGATATAYGAGAIYLNGVVNSPVNFANKSNSTTAFQVQNAASTQLFVVDTANSRVQIGSSTTDTTANFFVVDSYSTVTDPAGGLNGAIYYNTGTNTFRCYENSAWADCLSRHVLTMPGDITDNTGNCTYTNATGLSFSVLSGRTYRFHATINYTTGTTNAGGSAWAVSAGNAATTLSYKSENSLTATTSSTTFSTAYDGPACNATSAATGGNIAILDGIFVPSANDTFVVRFAAENTGTTIAKTGSTLEWW